MKLTYLLAALALTGCAKSPESAINAYYAETYKLPHEYSLSGYKEIGVPRGAEAISKKRWFATVGTYTSPAGRTIISHDTLAMGPDGGITAWGGD